MQQNVGEAERIFRIVVGLTVALLAGLGLFFEGTDSWMYWAIVLVGVGVLLNGLTGRCGFYAALGLSSCKIDPGDGVESGQEDHSRNVT